ncbi:proto-oncogene Mas-like [Micropterus dolomieu]|uniref:proto-oncogene Mas-like n=1 Tax=Micropterus dolomieu TaxID=147949 RepID=UPI001E8E08E0|nr:proto-oncogene Mas-like [Micropterus dolomieu]
MEGFYMNSTYATTNYQNYSNITSNYQNYNELEEYYKLVAITFVPTCIIIAICLPLTLVAIHALYSMVRSDHVAPIYVINLLIADILQFCFLITEVAKLGDVEIYYIFEYIYIFGLMASIYFMVSIALERYLVIAHPLWYRCRRTIKSSVAVCVLVWVLPFADVVPYYFFSDGLVYYTITAIFFLLPFPLLIFFLVGTLKALSASISVPSDEKQRIVGVLVLVLLIYTLLFLPKIISFLIVNTDNTFFNISLICIRLSPLADLVLYVFMRKGIIDKLLASVCCCRMDSSDISSPPV